MHKYRKAVEKLPPKNFPKRKCQRIVKEYWGLIMEFTNGDMSMLPKLMEIGNIDAAINAWEERQKIVNGYLEPALQVYFSRLGENPFEGGEIVWIKLNGYSALFAETKQGYKYGQIQN